MSLCSVCGDDASASNSHRHKECGHLTHTKCVKLETLNYKTCSACLNPAEEPWPSLEGGDPHPGDGRDYVLEPGQRNQPTVWSAVTSLIGKRQNGPAPPTALELLQKRIPIDVLMKKHKIGLHHVLKEGGNVMDYLSNGYTWNDLLKYEDMSKKGPERAFQTVQALGMSANHFRTFPGQLPWGELKKHMQLDTNNLCENFGLCFTQVGAPISCEGDETPWNALDLIKLGVTMDDLLSFGMTHVEQYQDLMNGLTRASAQDAERKLKTTMDHMNQLVSFEDPVEEEEEQKPIPKVEMVKPTPPPIAASTALPKYMIQYNARKARHGTVN